jgi:hypothetical protein
MSTTSPSAALPISINGWLAVLLTFLLARVFARGTLMREDLEGTRLTWRSRIGSA